MVLPLQIRVSDGPVRLTAAAVPYGVSVRQALDFAFLVETDDGIVDVMTPHQYHEFACNSKACAPPPVGKGGSDKGGASGAGGGRAAGGNSGSGGGSGRKMSGSATETTEDHPDHPMSTKYAAAAGAIGGGEDDERDMARLRVTDKGATVRADGILEEPWLDADGNVVLTKAQEKAFAGALEKMGTSEQTWEDNLFGVAQRAAAGDISVAKEAQVWYQREHDTWGKPLAAEMGMSVEQIMAIATVTSTNATWDTHNKPVAERIARMVKEDQTFTVTPEQAAEYNAFSSDKKGSGGSWGARTIEPGTYKASELSTGTLARVAGSGYGVGGQYFTSGLVKAFALARGEVTPNQAIPSLKQRSFFNNLARPGVDYSSTNDFWMTRAAFGDSPLTFNSKNVKGTMNIKQYEAVAGQQANSLIGSKGTGTSSMFAGMTRATKSAMGRLSESDPRFKNITTNEFQALVWIQMQKEYDTLPGGTP